MEIGWRKSCAEGSGKGGCGYCIGSFETRALVWLGVYWFGVNGWGLAFCGQIRISGWLIWYVCRLEWLVGEVWKTAQRACCCFFVTEEITEIHVEDGLLLSMLEL
jgi:hypothetical protein